MGNCFCLPSQHDSLTHEEIQIEPAPPAQPFIRKIQLAKKDYSGLFIPTKAHFYLFINKPNLISIGSFDNRICGVIDQINDICLLFQHPFMVAFRIANYNAILDNIYFIDLKYQRPGFWSNFNTGQIDDVNSSKVTFYIVRGKQYIIPATFKLLAESFCNLDEYAKKVSNQMNFKEIPDNDRCKICYDYVKTKIFITCGHFCICTQCYDALKNKRCPICRNASLAINVYT